MHPIISPVCLFLFCCAVLLADAANGKRETFLSFRRRNLLLGDKFGNRSSISRAGIYDIRTCSCQCPRYAKPIVEVLRITVSLFFLFNFVLLFIKGYRLSADVCVLTIAFNYYWVSVLQFSFTTTYSVSSFYSAHFIYCVINGSKI